jgi:nucleoid DNA-binding protein
MASRIQAINAYRPRVKLGRRAENKELVEFIARSTGLNESGVSQVLLELRDAVVFFNRQGRAVKLEGLGTYTPSVDLEGQIKVSHRADSHLKRELNDGDFRGDIERRENVGKTSDDLVTMWNDDNPDDPVA